MCEKKPGPRCASHLTAEIDRLDDEVVKQKSKLEGLQEKEQQMNQERRANPDPDERKRMFDEGQQFFYREILPVQRALHIAEVKNRDAQKRFLGTKTGQKRAYERMSEMRASGEYGFNIANYQRQTDLARDAHVKNLIYAKWAEKVRSGEIPGRWVESEGTQQSPHLEYSDDPLYDATAEEIASLSAEDLQMTMSSRYGGYAMTPATKEKVLDSLRDRSQQGIAGDPENAAERARRLEAKDPEGYKRVTEGDFNGNYLRVDPSHINFESDVRLASYDLTRTVRTSKDEKLTYPEALGRAVSKERIPSVVGGDTLVLDDGSTVKVSKTIYSMLRLDGGRTGLVKQ